MWIRVFRRLALTSSILSALVACGPTREGGDGGDAARDARDVPSFDIQRYDVPEDDPGFACVTNDDCFGNADGPHCDRASQRCRACLPNPNTCGAGTFCDDSFRCVPGCSSDPDCVTDGGRPDGGGGIRCLVALHRCVQCLGDLDCPGGDLVCGSEHTCIMGCSDAHPCAAGSDCCSGVCVNLLTDATHCGSCPHSCEAGGTCCGGVCFNLTTDARNCGGCGTRCSVPNATPACTAGRCAVGTCFPGYGDCDGMAANGCETLLTNDVNHCGTCATTCVGGTHGTALCQSGICTFNCTGGYLHCSMNPADGCEVDPQTNAANCGACGYACTSANATGGCTAGACTVASCNAGFSNCDGLAANGCEVATLMDPANCGGCFRSCPTGPNATARCAAAVCSISCRAGFGDCNALPADGCESSFAIDPSHCGSCSTVCPARANATATCTASVCGVACQAGFRDCNAVATDGCEINVRTDRNNCGSCGMACAAPNATPSCTAGGCAIASCNAGYSNCNGLVSDGCEVNSSIDSSNCGACGTICTGGTICVAGACALVNPFPSTGAEGAFNPTTSTTLTPGVHDFTTINIPAGVIITVSLGAASNGVLDLRATGDVTIAGTINLSGGNGGNGIRGTGGGGGGATGLQQTASAGMPGLGGSPPAGAGAMGCGANASGGTNGGGAGAQGAATVGGGGGGGPAGGAGGLIGGVCVAGAGGGGATAGAGGQSGGPPYDGVPGQSGNDACGGLAAGGGGGSIGSSAATDLRINATFAPGSGGGGGSGSYGTGLSAAEGGGGGGGGAIRISSPSRITITGTVRADGGRGGNGSDANTTCTLAEGGSGGGGGSGGAIFFAAPTLSVGATAIVSALGGAGGLRGANVSGGDGGAGGLGRVRVSASQATCTLSGAFTPPLRSGCALSNTSGFGYVGAYPR